MRTFARFMNFDGVAALAVLAVLAVASSLGAAAATPAAPAASPATATAAAVDLPRYAPGALTAWGVPGAAIAIVKDGRVALLAGFGTRALGRPEPVGPHTLFSLASLSKGFTAAAAGSLVDAGTLSWDEPLQQLLPGFAVADPVVTRELTVRDALAHRSGLSETVDAGWDLFGSDRGEILRRLAFAPQGAPFRDGFTYLNTLYVAVGEGLAHRAGTTYEELVRTRILEPLALGDARFGAAVAQAVTDRASPHIDFDGTMRVAEPDDADAIAPAAGLSASASDLARWLLALLGDGTLDGKRVLGPETTAALRSPQAIVPFEHIPKAMFPSTHFLAYGFGWMLQDYRGQLVVWNTGGLRGMTCSAAFLPERGFGVAVLTNGPRISLPEALVWRAIDAELGVTPARDWSAERLQRSLALRAATARTEAERYTARRAGAAPPALPVTAYAGRYEQPMLGIVSVAAADGGLAIRLGRGLTGTLAPWDGETFLATWHPADYGHSTVRFTAGDDGRAAALEIEDLGRFTRVAP